MTGARLVRGVGLVLASVVLTVSGVYVIVDLARWEWNRATLSGLVFVAALVVVVAMVVMRELRRIEDRITGTGRVDDPLVHRALAEPSTASVAHRFRWLTTPPDRLGVFVPVLLGAGVIVSFLTYAIERLAGAVATSTVDRATVRFLRTDLPLGNGLVDGGARPEARPLGTGALVAAGLVTVLLSVIAVGALRDLVQTRPGEITAGGASVLVVGIEQRRTADPAVVVAAGLWSACRSRLPAGITVRSIDPTGPDEATITIDRALGRTGRLRITGCLEDHTMDLVRADVRAVTITE
jgi:hypothetical protein